jgi:hypothetical protein
MRKIRHFGFFVLILILSSCSVEIVFKDYIDRSVPFILTTKTTNIKTGLTESKSETIDVNSDKWGQLYLWTYTIKEGWRPTPASHVGDVYVSHGTFKLIYTRDSRVVVVELTDKEGNSKQYINGIQEGELSFLYE